MTPPKKPEWIHIADTDNAASVRKVSKALPAIALGSALMIIGAGVAFAQSNNDVPAAAVESVISSQSTISAQPALDNAPTKGSTTSLRIQNIATQKPTSQGVSDSPIIAPKAPALQMPTGGGDDEDEDFRGARGHGDEHDDDYEGDDD
ncbi:MAG: hypothetical protein NTZ06_05475 [Actinobacteria bacterium]|nr:hypothetical protein [Actinomycetota bacterium]